MFIRASRLMFMLALAALPPVCVPALEHMETFDSDPGWDGRNNRPDDRDPVIIRQDFGYEASSPYFAGSGGIGGIITPAGETACYAKALPERNLGDALQASGKLVVPKGRGNTLFGFFNAGSVNEWRTPNAIVIRINGRGDVFHAHVEYATSLWRAGASYLGTFNEETNRMNLEEFPSGDHVYEWSMKYDPQGNGGGGEILFTLDGRSATCKLNDGHKADGAAFNRFGLLNVIKSYDDTGEIHLADITILGQAQDLSTDPQWEGRNNRVSYPSRNVRPWFDYGFSPTQHAGGVKPGEMGGLTFRGDCREAMRMGCYADRLSTLTLAAPMRASGKVAMLRGVTDSTTLLGFFNAETSMRENPSQKHGTPPDFLGVAIEGPSSDGFLFYPIFRGAGEIERYGQRRLPGNVIYPDGSPHTWALDYVPGDGGGRITVVWDGQETVMEMEMKPEDVARMASTRFTRFGLISTHIDGNGQTVYFDDLTYTIDQKKP